MTNRLSFDVIIVGGGIAGASLAYFLSPHLKVAIVEREPQAGYHATGRSAALFSETYGTPLIRALSVASGAFLRSPPAGFAGAPLLRPRGALYISTQEQRADMDGFVDGLASSKAAHEIEPEKAIARVPALRRAYLDRAVLEPSAADIDVDLLLQGFLRHARAAGAQLFCGHEATGPEFGGGLWSIATADLTLQSALLVNAAGAWADDLAERAGVAPIGLAPKLRNAALADPPQDLDIRGWPMVFDVGERFYFKPDAGKLLVSPADAIATPPCDAYSDDLEIAIAIDRIQQAADLDIRRVSHSWAGLRTFAPDNAPVVGFDADHGGFFWLAGQGGYGIQTAPAMGALAASLILGRPPGDPFAAVVEVLPHLRPTRFSHVGALTARTRMDAPG